MLITLNAIVQITPLKITFETVEQCGYIFLDIHLDF